MSFTKSASANRVALRYIKETDPGVTPADPQMQEMSYTTNSLRGSKTTTQSATIRPDSNVEDLVTTELNAAGDINFEWSYGTHDDFIASAFRGTWVGDVLVNGLVDSAYTIEKHYTDKDKLMVFRGAQVGGMELAIALGAIMTGRFSFMCRSKTSTTTPLDPTPTPVPNAPKFSSVTDLKSFKINNVEYEDAIQSYNLQVSTNPRAQRGVNTGGAALAGVGMGDTAFTGTLSSFFGDATAILSAYDNDTTVSMSFKIAKFGQEYTFEFPKVKIGAADPEESGKNTDVQIQIQWQALYDAGIGGTCRVTRKPA